MRRAPEVLKHAYLGKSSGTYHLPLVRPSVRTFIRLSLLRSLPLDRPSPSDVWYRHENWPVNRNYHLYTVCIPARIIIVTIAVDAVREGALEMKMKERDVYLKCRIIECFCKLKYKFYGSFVICLL